MEAITWDRLWTDIFHAVGVFFLNKVKLSLMKGNQRIHQLTSQGWYELRVDMSDFSKKSRFAYYRIFSVGNKTSGYRLTVGEYEGNAGTMFIRWKVFNFRTIMEFPQIFCLRLLLKLKMQSKGFPISDTTTSDRLGT